MIRVERSLNLLIRVEKICCLPVAPPNDSIDSIHNFFTHKTARKIKIVYKIKIITAN
jgi:hypothetical protein